MNRSSSRSFTGWITKSAVRWIVLVISLALAFGLASFASKLSGEQENEIAAWLPGDAQSTRLAERAKAFAPDDEIAAIAVYVRKDGIQRQDVQRVLVDAQKIRDIDGVTQVVAPKVADPMSLTDRQMAKLTSKDGQALQLLVQFEVGGDAWEKLPDVADDMRQSIEPDPGVGLQTYVGGPMAFAADQATAFAGVEGMLLLAALAVVIVMLLLTYRSPILWLIPLFCGVLSVFAAEGLVYLMAANTDVTVNGQSAGILAVLVLGASIDYALLLVARYREELRNFESRYQAMAHALQQAAPAIIASGATVILGLLCLAFADQNSTAGLGPVIATGIAAALLVMLVILPLILVMFGRWVFWPFIPQYGQTDSRKKSFWARVGDVIARRPRAVWMVTAGLLAVACLGVTQLNPGQLSQEEIFTTEQKSTVANDAIAKHFPAGGGAPLQVIAKAGSAKEVAEALDTVDGLAPARQSSTGPAGITKDGQTYFERTMVPAIDSEAANDVVRDARAALEKVDGADTLVGGSTAIMLDVADAADRDNKLIIPLILVVVLVILAILLRSIVAPVILLATVVLSFGAALGLSALVFQYVFGFDGVDTSFALLTFVFLVALGIDYNIFLMTRIREESVNVGTRRGALVGLAATGGVITSAGLVLAGTFSSLAILPIVFLAQTGFTVALGVLLDTLIVRSVLVTALTLDFGRLMWWPSRLSHSDASPPEAPSNR